MEDYLCQNTDCGETWEVNEQNGLIQGAIDSDYWAHLSESDNCLACDDNVYENSSDWQWVRYIR